MDKDEVQLNADEDEDEPTTEAIDCRRPDVGEWACYWRTAGYGSRVLSRHATAAEAAAAAATRDWAHYLCRYEVRQWDGERWVVPCDSSSPASAAS